MLAPWFRLARCTPGAPPRGHIPDNLLTWLREPDDYESVGRAFESPGAHQLHQQLAASTDPESTGAHSGSIAPPSTGGGQYGPSDSSLRPQRAPGLHLCHVARRD